MNRIPGIPALAGLTLVLAFSACDQTPTQPTEYQYPPINTNPIVFSDMKVGQVSTYLSFEVSGYFRQEHTFERTYDSLIVTVAGVHPDGYLINERYVDMDTTNWPLGSDTMSYVVQVVSDTLRSKYLDSWFPPSRLFSGLYGRFIPGSGMPLEPFTDVRVTLNNWEPVFPQEESSGQLNSINLFGQKYGPLNVRFSDSSNTDGPTQWWLYSREDGIVRYIFISVWTDTGYGWDLLP